MRIGLLDSRWLEQRDRALGDRATQDAVLAQGIFFFDTLTFCVLIPILLYHKFNCCYLIYRICN